MFHLISVPLILHGKNILFQGFKLYQVVILLIFELFVYLVIFIFALTSQRKVELQHGMAFVPTNQLLLTNMYSRLLGNWPVIRGFCSEIIA